MKGFKKNENQESDIKLEDFSSICRICLKRNSQLFKMEDYLLELYQTITKINVCSTVNLPKNICSGCIKTLEDISLFINSSKNNDSKSRQNLMQQNRNGHKGMADDLEYFKEFEICRICYSRNDLKPVEGKAHLMQLFRNITKVDAETEVIFSDRNSVCNKCVNELETISLFISVSVINEMTLKNTIGRYEASETENCLEGNAFNVGFLIKVKKEDDCDKNAHGCGSESLHTIIDIKQEIVDTPEASNEEINRIGIEVFCESHSGENPLDCGPCKDEFTNGTHLENLLKGSNINLEIQSGTNPFKCDSCDESFTTEQSLKRHVRTHFKKNAFKCGRCEKTFSNKANLQLHMFSHTGEKPFECGSCTKSFTQKGNLKRHMIIHTGEKQFKCDCCERSFMQKSHLQQHMIIHTGEKQFECDCCLKSFNQKSNLQQHMLIHSGEKHFKCNSCEKSFTHKSTLQNHMLLHSGAKPFKCDCCEKTFAQKVHLKLHMFSHTGEKPFKCGCCFKIFAQKCHLQQHMVIHTGEKPFKCDFCKMSFTQKQSLNAHLLTYTEEKLFKCDSCEKTFRSKGNLHRHMIIHT